MKKLAILLMLLLAVTAMGQTVIKENNLYGYTMFSGWSGDKFANVNGGLKIGTIISLDSDRKLFLRTGYSSLNWGNSLVQSIDIVPTLNWYLGNRWSFYALGGLTGYVSGENEGLDAVGGFGASRRVWTSKQVGSTPASLDLFGEVLLSQSRDQATGGLAQINIGVKFGRAEN